MLIVIALLLFLILNVLLGGKLVESIFSTLGLLLVGYIVWANWEIVSAIAIFVLTAFVMWWAYTLCKGKFGNDKPKLLPKTNANQRKELLAASKEIDERIFQHPDGYFLLVGQQGGIKLFRNLGSAQNSRKPARKKQ